MWGQPIKGLKVGETKLEMDEMRAYQEMGRGRVVFQCAFDKKKKDDWWHEQEEVEVRLGGFTAGWDLEEEKEAEIRASSFSGSPEDALIFAKALTKAARYAQKKRIGKREVAKQKKLRAIRKKEEEEYQAKQKKIADRRKLKWNEDTRTDENGLFQIVPNNNPKWKEQSKKWLVLGPQHGSMGSYDDENKNKPWDKKVTWGKVKHETAVSTIKQAKKEAQRMLDSLIYNKHVEEVGETGRMVLTKEFKERQKKRPLEHRDNSIKKAA